MCLTQHILIIWVEILKWWYPHFTPQVMIIFSRKNQWLLGTTMLGNPHILYNLQRLQGGSAFFGGVDLGTRVRGCWSPYLGRRRMGGNFNATILKWILWYLGVYTVYYLFHLKVNCKHICIYIYIYDITIYINQPSKACQFDPYRISESADRHFF